jgi:hypothetical protein
MRSTTCSKGESVAQLSSLGEINVLHMFCTSRPRLETQNNARDHSDHPVCTEIVSQVPGPLQDNLGEIVMFDDISQISDTSRGHPLANIVEEHNILVQSIVSDVGNAAENQGFHRQESPYERSMPFLHNFMSLSTSGRMSGSSETREYASV